MKYASLVSKVDYHFSTHGKDVLVKVTICEPNCLNVINWRFQIDYRHFSHVFYNKAAFFQAVKVAFFSADWKIV